MPAIDLKRAGVLGCVAAAYLGAGTLGIELEVAQGVITPVWAPTGIALVAVLLLGYRAWPAIAVGAFLTNAINDAPVHLAAGIAVGNTLEAVVGAWLLHRAHFDTALARIRDVLALVFLAGLVSTAISASVGTGTLWLGDELGGPYPSSWFLWWFGDLMGVIIVAPLLLVWLARPLPRLPRERLVEACVLLVTLAIAATLVFFGGNWEYPSVLFPLLLWATLRYGQRGVATTMFLVASLAVAAAVDGSVAIEGTTMRQTAQIIQALLAVVGVPLMVLAAAIEEREKVDDSLRDSLQLHQAILQSTDDGILVVDDDGRIVSFNARFADLWSIPASVMAERDDDLALATVADQLVDPDGFLERVRDLYLSGEIEDVGELRFKDGRIYERRSRPYRAAGHRGRVWSVRDVTAQRTAEQVKQRFLGMATHELRTPLAVASGATSLLLDEWEACTDEQKRDLLERVRAQANRMSHLVDDLLLTSTIESGGLRPQPRSIAVADVVRQAVAEVGQGEVRTGLDGMPDVLVDPNHLHQVLVNLLTNAEKYGHLPIAVEAHRRGQSVELHVRDEGEGVPAELLPRLFEPFARSRAAAEGRVPGTGLGLSIARSLARAQGGDVRYDNGHGRGACFTVILPVAATT